MAESDSEKTLEPTQKRLDDAVERGDVAKSQELGSWFILAAGGLGFFLFAKQGSADLLVALRGLLAHAAQMPVDRASLMALARRSLWMMAGAVGMPMLLLLIAALGGNAIQHRLVWSVEPITPSLSKLSPLAGIKRLYGKEAWVNFGKGLVKLAIVGTVLVSVLWPLRDRFALLLTGDIAGLGPFMFSTTVHLLGAVLAILAFVALADYVYQRRAWYERQRMTVEEVKEEHKQSEGNPEIKGRIRKLRRQRASRRMMQNVPKASVVITNPTHFAVALRYEPGMGAPICIAKGVDKVAFRIRALAEENGITIMENPPLARALHASVEVDAEIPGEHYKAVAEVISYVMKLRARPRWVG